MVYRVLVGRWLRRQHFFYKGADLLGRSREGRLRHGGALREKSVSRQAVFSFDIGASAGFYKTLQNSDRFFTLSVYPLFRFTFLRTAAADMYFAYSLAGPTYISKSFSTDHDTGRHFTFQDFMGIGGSSGQSRNLNAGVKINHYSNGNIFTQNAGVKIPLTFSVGYAF